MVVDEGLGALRHLTGAQPGLLSADVDSLGGHEGRDKGMALPALDERPSVVDRDPFLCGQLGVKDRPAEEPSDPERLNGAGDRVLEVVEVEERGRSREEHLGDAGAGARFDVRFGPMRVHREERLEEPRELPVVGDPPQEAHRDVGVGVDEPWHDGEPRGIDFLLGRSLADVPHGGDPSAFDPKVPADHAPLRVLSDQKPPSEHDRPGRGRGHHAGRD